MPDSYTFFATAPRGVEPILEQELAELGAVAPLQRKGGASFGGDLATGYRICLWSRSASRVLLGLARTSAESAEGLYASACNLPWEEHLSPEATLAVDFVGTSPTIAHPRFGAQKVKDAVVDRLRRCTGRRPSVDLDRPDLRIHVHLARTEAQIAIDLSGEALHRRGYRNQGLAAPLKENLAAALLLKADWPALARAGASLLDPMCGCGTFPIEAALIAGDRAPGLLRPRWGFHGWLGHIPAVWQDILEEARQRATDGQQVIPAIAGGDEDPRAIRAAGANAASAGLGGRIRFEQRALAEQTPPGPPGLVIVNPPYGERLGDTEDLAATYAALGDLLKARFAGWRAAVFTARPELGKRMGLRARRRNQFYNGALPCVLLQFDVQSEHFVDREALDRRARERALAQALAGGGEAFLNRIRKNRRTLGRWARRERIECYRLYDADIPELAVAVDLYGPWVHVQAYAPPPSIDPDKAARRLEQVLTLLPVALECPPNQVIVKVRRRQRRDAQYEKLAERRQWLEVREGPARLLVNLTDYLDTGLFLDHRPTRALIGGLARGRRFLNLFCYTGAATVHAALGGARSTCSVDLSATYLEWASRNLALNDITGKAHELIRADCREWVDQCRRQFDLIFLDPPTFSSSKRMEGTWDVQRDHVGLIQATAALLGADGVLIFSTNHRRFRLDRAALAALQIEDITRKTLPPDFARNPRIHRCFLIRRGPSAPGPRTPPLSGGQAARGARRSD